MEQQVAAVKEALAASLGQLREQLHGVPLLGELEEKTHVPREYLSLAGALLLFLVIVCGMSAGTLSSLAAFVYPAYMSFRAVERPVVGEATQWLVYWVLFSIFAILESFAATLLYWIPFYYAFKFAFLLWAFLPQTRGAKFLYDNFLKDLKPKSSALDAALEKAKGASDALGRTKGSKKSE